MTTKEKAKELINKFKPYSCNHRIGFRYPVYDYNAGELNAKQCALIAVVEIISEWQKGTGLDYQAELKYWKEVKEAINKQ